VIYLRKEIFEQMNKKKSALGQSHPSVKSRVTAIFLLFLGAYLLMGCNSEPQIVEVTRLVNEEVPVTVEVSQVTTVEVPMEVTVEVPVEVTRLVEVVISATPLPTESATAVPTDTPTATATAVPAGSLYTVQPGDTLVAIATMTGVGIADIMEANELSDQNTLQAGQELVIPGWDGTPLAAPTVSSSPTTAAAEGEPTVVVTTSDNLLPNASFEDDWYFFNGINELQIPIGWATHVDEGHNTLTDDPEDLFLRPEIRVVPSHDLPAHEVPLFVYEGSKTIKAFKGGAPTSFAIFTDITLPAGFYRFTINFFPDIVAVYQGGQKVWATDPLAAEVRFILNNGGSDWASPAIGTKNTMTYEFTLTQPATVRLGAAFRNRYVNNNNSWFLDDWSLYRVGEP
jgi:LysM repeat protein